ncbi:hypothetical protein ILUMI_00264, partial [Ignelater luminosus]
MDRRKNARNFYQKVKQQTRTCKPKIRGIKNKEGKTVQTEEEIKEVWMNYFKKILNEEQAAEEIIIAKGEESMEIKEPTLKEISKERLTLISRNRVTQAMGDMEISTKLIKLVAMTMRDSKACVKINGSKKEEFTANKGVRQGDAHSTTIFNIALEYMTKI